MLQYCSIAHATLETNFFNSGAMAEMPNATACNT